MKKLTYILLFIWNIGIGQRDELTDLKIALGATSNNDLAIDTAFIYDAAGSLYLIIDSTLTTTVNGRSDTSTIIEFRGFERYEFGNFKYDTVKAVLMVCDSIEIASITEEGQHKRSIYDERIKWLYGYVIIQSEYGTWPISTSGDVLGLRPGYGNKKTIAYLDITKEPFSKEIIIWDYKIIE